MKKHTASTHLSTTKIIFLWLMAGAYILAGVNHFIHPDMYLRIIPQFVPAPKLANWMAGAAEVLLGVLLLLPSARNIAAWGIIALLIAVFPANIKMTIDYTSQQHPMAWVTWLRLPLQVVLVWWAYSYTNHRQRLFVRRGVVTPS